MKDEQKSLDILGVKPVAESINKVTSATVDGAAAFLGRICLPAAEEFGLLLRDRVRNWRAANVAAIAARAEDRLNQADASSSVHAHPRLVSGILEVGSWVDDAVVQDLWAGLLSSSCTEAGDDDSNLIFVNLLADLTKLQARLLKHLCENAPKSVASNGLIQSQPTTVQLANLTEITGESDIHRLDREIDHLRQAGLVHGGFEAFSVSTDPWLAPTTIALHMYVRCQGSRSSPTDFFGIGSQKVSSEAAEQIGEQGGDRLAP